MTREEYEARKRALEAQHLADIALMDVAHQARLRNLEELWQASRSPGAPPRPAAVSATAPAPPAPGPPRQPAAPKRRQALSVLADLSEALPTLPEVFDKHDIVRTLGYEPPRATLFRALRALGEQGRIETESTSIGGNTTSRYRKLAPAG